MHQPYFILILLFHFTLVTARISDSGLRHIIESPCGVKLKELNLTNCVRIGDIVLVNIHKRYRMQLVSPSVVFRQTLFNEQDIYLLDLILTKFNEIRVTFDTRKEGQKNTTI